MFLSDIITMLLFAIILILFGSICIFFSFTPYFTEIKKELQKRWKKKDLNKNQNLPKDMYQEGSELAQINSDPSAQEVEADLHIQGFLYQDFSHALHKTSASMNNIAHFIKCIKKLRREGRAYLIVNKNKIELKTQHALYTYSSREFEEFLFYSSGVALVPLVSSLPNYIFLSSNIQQLKSYIKEHSPINFE